MKRLFIIFCLLGSLCAQEIRRPSADNNITTCDLGSNFVSGSGASARDNNGSTEYSLFLNGETCTPDEVFGHCNGVTTYHSGRRFTGWSAASGTYTALKLKIQYSSYASQDGATQSVSPSAGWYDYTESGSVGTFYITTPTTSLPSLFLEFCVVAPPQNCTSFNCNAPSASYNVVEIWTEGTLASGRKGQVIVVSSLEKKPRYEWRKQLAGKEVVVGWTHHYSKAKRWADIVRSSA
jgi:hypothetical protein